MKLPPCSWMGKWAGPLILRAKRRLASTSLLARVLAMVTLGLVTLFAGFVMLSAQSIRDGTSRTLHERLLIAEVTARNLDEHLLQIARLAAVEAADLPTLGGERTEETRAAWRLLRLQFGPAVHRIAAISADGRLLWTSPYSESLLWLDLSDVPVVRAALRDGEIHIDDSELSLVPSPLVGSGLTPTLSILSPMRSQGKGLVLIVVDLNQPGVADILKQVQLGQTGYAEVVGRNGRVLATPHPHRLGIIDDHGGWFAARIEQGKGLVTTCHSCHGETTAAGADEEVLAFAPLAHAPLGVGIRQSSGEAFAFGEALLQRALLFGAVSFIVALGLSWLVVIRMVRPVKVLTNACLRMAEGDLSEPVQPMGGGEMSILASSFESMRSRLKASQEEVRRWGRELERMVSERTAELQEARDKLERSRDFLRTLFDSLEDQLAVIDADYRVVEANRALRRRYGEGRSPVGEPCHRVFHGAEGPCELQCGWCPAKAVWRTGQPSRVTQVHLDVSGRSTYLDIVASPIRNGHGQIVNVLEVARDVTESKRLEERAIRTSEELSTLVSLSSAIACSMDLRAMLGVALDHVLALMGAPAGGILLDAAEGEVDSTVVARGIGEQVIRKLAVQEPRPKDRTEFRRVRWNGRKILCMPIATGESVLGEMFIACSLEDFFGSSCIGQQLLVSIGSQLAVAVENARLYDALRRKEGAISAFLRKYIAAQEEERKRIARELHDDTAQSLAALAMAIETALQVPARSVAQLKSLLEPARPLAERVSTEIDRIIHDLRPSLLDDLGLLEALRWYADHRLKPLGIRVTFEGVRSEQRLTPELETALFRVAQEAMSNVARHARAKNVRLRAEFGADHAALEIEDDGCGFDVRSAFANGKDGGDDAPFGLLGMHERVNLLGGTLAVDSRPGQGTTVRVRVPLQMSQRLALVGGAEW